MTTPWRLRRLQEQLGYQFSQADLLNQAITHRSAGSENNERLEFLGDAVLGQAIAQSLFFRFPQATEGQLSRLRASLVRKETLAEIARELELHEILILGPGELKSGGASRASILADSVEALIAAVFLDASADAADALVKRLWLSRIDELRLSDADKDAKTQLQEYLQARKLPLPDYTVVKVEGEAHKQTFFVACEVPELSLQAEANGSSRKRAEQSAAQTLLAQLSA